MAAHRQGRFWDYHDTLFVNMKALEDDDLVKYAGELGLDIEKFNKDRKDPEILKKVEADQNAAVSLGAKGTPAFFVNGNHVKGAKGFDEFKKLIDAELAKADAKLAAGLAADNVAFAVTADNNKQAFDLLVRHIPASKPKPPPAVVWKVPVHEDDASKGAPAEQSLITIAEWSEFQ